jgi:L-ascorbate metabolism protein UlaG (beta-lactamase superfamily)
MNISLTKFSHSCVLLEQPERVILFGPGDFSWAEGLIQKKLESLNSLDYLMLTHIHPDHCFVDAIKFIKLKFPQVKIITTNEARQSLSLEGIEADTESDNPDIIITKTDHAHLNQTLPIFENIQVEVKDILTHLGDSMNIAKLNTPLLCLPFFGSWEQGTFTDAMNSGLKLKPKYIIPIHDYHYKPEFRDSFYDRASDTAKGYGGELICTEDGKNEQLKL